MGKEASRLQDLALAMTLDGREEMIDLAEIARERYLLNEEVIRESRRKNVEVRPPQTEPDLLVFCSRFGLSRVLDNLLNNATKAIPKEGGSLEMECRRRDNMASISLMNTGEIPAQQIEQVRRGEVKGRGLNIISRFVQSNHGKIEITAAAGVTKITILLPLQTVA